MVSCGVEAGVADVEAGGDARTGGGASGAAEAGADAVAEGAAVGRGASVVPSFTVTTPPFGSCSRCDPSGTQW